MDEKNIAFDIFFKFKFRLNSQICFFFTNPPNTFNLSSNSYWPSLLLEFTSFTEYIRGLISLVLSGVKNISNIQNNKK